MVYYVTVKLLIIIVCVIVVFKVDVAVSNKQRIHRHEGYYETYPNSYHMIRFPELNGS